MTDQERVLWSLASSMLTVFLFASGLTICVWRILMKMRRMNQLINAKMDEVIKVVGEDK